MGHAEAWRLPRRMLAAASLAGALGLVSAPARAQSSIELSWDAPPECPQVGAVRERLQALTGQPTQARRHLHASGRVERVGKRYRLILSVREGDGMRARTMNADSCNDLAGAAAVALGLLIRNERAGTGSDDHTSGGNAAGSSGSEAAGASATSGPSGTNAPSNAGGDRSSSAAPSGPATSNKASEKNEKNEKNETAQRKDEEGSPDKASAGGTARERRWRILLRAPVGVVALGRLPKPSGGIGASVGASYDEWRVNLGARIFETQTLVSHNAYEAGARVGRRDIELAVCRDWRDGRLALAPCVIGAVQQETVRGSGPGVTPEPKSPLSLVVAGAGEARFFAFDWAALVASVAVGLETSWPSVQVTTVGDVRKLGPVEVAFSLGPEWIF